MSGGGSGRQRGPAAPPRLEFRIGDDVIHPVFGEGVVTSTDPRGGTYGVRFASGDQKQFVAEAPVRKR
jgi:hypothetical protein